MTHAIVCVCIGLFVFYGISFMPITLNLHYGSVGGWSRKKTCIIALTGVLALPYTLYTEEWKQRSQI